LIAGSNAAAPPMAEVKAAAKNPPGEQRDEPAAKGEQSRVCLTGGLGYSAGGIQGRGRCIFRERQLSSKAVDRQEASCA